MTGSTNKKNDAYDWNKFETNKYHMQYKGKVLWEDRSLGNLAINAIQELTQELGIKPGSLESSADLANGGVLRGPSFSAPFVKEGGTIVWSDNGDPQCLAAQEVIALGKARGLGDWEVHQRHLSSVHPIWREASYRACDLGIVVKRSIFDTPEEEYDIVTTCFGPESLTGDRNEWETALTTTLKSVKRGGFAVVLFMIESTGYSSAGEPYPATSVTVKDVSVIARKHLKMLQTFSVDTAHGARREDDPFTYKGMGGIVGARK